MDDREVNISPIICAKCQLEISNSHSVSCDKCKSTFHEICVKVNDNMLVWNCVICDMGEASNLKPPTAPRSQRSRHSSRHPSSSSSSKQKAILDAFDEETRLLQQQAKEKEDLLKANHEQQLDLIRRKQNALNELASVSSGSSKASSQAHSINSAEKVKSWIESQSRAGHQSLPRDNFLKPPELQFRKENIHSSTQVPGHQSTTFKVNPSMMTCNQPAIVSGGIVFSSQAPAAVKSKVAINTSLEQPTAPTQLVASHVEKNEEEIKTLSREEIAARHVIKSLPSFDGNPRLWPRFITSFHRSTKVCGFNNLENLERLSQALTGSAYAAVSSNLMMEENVPNILETLELLYGKPEFIINSLLDELRKTPSPSFENIDSILKYSLEIENLSSTMVNAKLSEHVWNPVLLSEMVDRLPTQLKFEWAAYKHAYSPCSIEVFSMWLKSKAIMYSSILTKPPSINNTNKREHKHSFNMHQEATDSKCLVCQKECSSIIKCKKFAELPLQEKWNLVRRLQICRICLTKHRLRKCEDDSVCGIDDCTFRHNKMLHNNKVDKLDTSAKDEDVPALMNVHAGSTTYFKILPVFLSNGSKNVMTYAMFDDGSSLTLIDNSLVDKLGLTGEKQPLCLRWTNGYERRDEYSKTVCLNISQYADSRSYRLNDVRTIDNLQLPSQSIDMESLSSTYQHLKDIKISSVQSAKPLLLIGLNHSKLMKIKRYKFGKDDEPAAAKTPLGWCLFGARANTSGSVLHIEQCSCEKSLDMRLEGMVRDNYLLEAIGISNPSSLPQAKDEKIAMDILNSTVKLCGNRFETGLLWKYSTIKLPNSLPMAQKRLVCLEHKCTSDSNLREIINNQIEDYISKGYAKKLNSFALQESEAWYLPIFVVRNANKPDKIRIVWDGAASVSGVSLNDVLLKGPDLLASLPGVLLRFREYKVAICGDIKEMFHQIQVKESDRKYQRFLWRKTESDPIDVYEMCVLTFGASCSPTCSQFVKNSNAERFREQFPLAVEAIQCNHYVDDWLQSVDSKEEAINLAIQVRNIHDKGGFQIHKWISNESDVVERLEGVALNVEKNMELSPTLKTDKVLGMFWKTSVDAFQFILKLNEENVKLMNGERIPTKRSMLKFLMSIFDPIGLITPILIFPKILLQMVWRSQKTWDEEIDVEQHTHWISWTKNLQSLCNFSVPRWIGLTKGTEIEVHTFVDASEDAFSAAVYFKAINDSGIKCSLIMSKSRVAPLKSLSIPRLELQAAVIGSRLAKFVIENSSPSHQITKRFYWTDSETVIKWLYSDSKKYTQYVSCRVGEILENSKLAEWNWIAGRQNISDMGTKMKLFDEFQLAEWIQGPQFLKNQTYPVRKPNFSKCQEELRPQPIVHQVAIHEEIEFRVSKWTKLRRVFAFVHRFIENMKLRLKNEPTLKGPFCREEYKRSEASLIKRAQIDGYSEEYMQLSEGKKLKNKRSPIFKDSAFIDSYGVLRSKGRVQSTPYVPYDTKNPILLPRDHRISEMILQFYHERYHHLYIATVANEIKQKFVVPRLKVKLNEIRKKCQVCKNRFAHPIIPEESELPPARITPFTRPFTYIGIDYFGPVQVIVGRHSEKRWVMLTTCLTTRAVHLEVVHTLSTDSCILALSRFMSRRGKPREIYTDNGTNFRGSKRELREIWEDIDKDKVAERFIDADTEWKFIPPASPHMGGAWERMVRTVKSCLKAAMPFKISNDELLSSMLAEVENIINNRPLTYVELDSEHQEALTPNHFILGSSSGVKPLGEFNDDSTFLRANWLKSQRFSNVFWKRWVSEYLPSLNRRTKWFQSQNKEIAVEDIVVVLGEEKRGFWPKGRIVEVHRGRDGKIRSADVQMETGIYTRPVSKLAILNVRRVENEGTLDEDIRIPGGNVAPTETKNALQSVPDTIVHHSRNLRALPHRINEEGNKERTKN